MNWQPIETAPRDGSWVLLWRGESTYGRWTPIVIGRWLEDEDSPAWVWPIEVFDPYTDDGRAEAEADIENGDHFESAEGQGGFTHWMPLPEPPPTNG